MPKLSGERIFRTLRRLEEWLLAACVLGVALLTIVNVICRSLLGFSLASAEELSLFLIVAITFLGIGYAVGRGRHIRMTAIYDQFGRKQRKVLMVLIASSTGLLMLALAWYSITYVRTVFLLGTASPVLQVPLAVIYLVAPLGFLLAAVQYALTVVRNVVEHDVYLSYDQKDEYEPIASAAVDEAVWSESDVSSPHEEHSP